MEQYRQEIALTDVRFFAYHGFYPEEQILGNTFLLTIRCTTKHLIEQADLLVNTINYETLYQIAKEEMDIPRKLLETVVQHILSRVKEKFSIIDELKVTLKKLNPPFGGDLANAEVTLYWSKEQ